MAARRPRPPRRRTGWSRDLNRVYRETPALWSQDTDPDGFHWIDANDAAGNVFSFLRFGDDGSVLACVANFSPVPHEGYRSACRAPGGGTRCVNTDADVVLRLRASATSARVDGRPTRPGTGSRRRPTLRVPPLGALWLRYAGSG